MRDLFCPELFSCLVTVVGWASILPIDSWSPFGVPRRLDEVKTVLSTFHHSVWIELCSAPLRPKAPFYLLEGIRAVATDEHKSNTIQDSKTVEGVQRNQILRFRLHIFLWECTGFPKTSFISVYPVQTSSTLGTR
ncbi:unnamed protein product [Protopolystoma xenopodis]|uniref:Uncharacterized protein n=1 Tax=Protopolystoma xenopodis TaxID=117903 RepID=A0A448WZT7_9PLAT|nr:unnamed protein product [Protopolystoma xenopodis]